MASVPSSCPEHGPVLVAFRYVLLIILLIYGCTLPGASHGISAFFVPRTWTGPGSIQVEHRESNRVTRQVTLYFKMPLSLFIFSYFITYIRSITFIQYMSPSPFAEVSLHLLIACKLSGKNLPRRIEL